MRLPAQRKAFDKEGLFFFGWDLGFDVHVAELARFEDFAALQALDIFRIFVTRDHLDSGMPTLIVHCVALRVVEGCVCWLACAHRSPVKR
jgi:hypothetical protein